MRLIFRVVAVAILTIAASGMAFAQKWPDRSIRFVVSQSAGNATDIIARVLADQLTPRLGQPVVVDNRPGGGNVIGTQVAARSAPDGYTFFLATAAALVTDPYTFKALPYDPMKDFVPVAKVAEVSFMIMANPKVPAKNLQELIAYAKERPGQLSFASSGNGTITHLIGELFNARAGINAVHVPYRTGVQSAPDVMEGRIHYIFDNIIWSLPQVRAGKIKGLAITTSRRSPLAPDIPTVAETVPGFEGITWLGLAAPAKTPDAVVARLDKELRAVLAEPDVIAKLAATGAEPPTAPGPEGMRTLLAQDIERWTGILREGKIKLQ
jgi:tripartite-type tricarboxylate transporter receptor subunit TctC